MKRTSDGLYLRPELFSDIMATAQITYKGELRTESLHLQSGERIVTDAPVDNHGKGEAFSPTDLLASSLGSCMLTIMGIAARERNIDIDGATCEVTKIMGTSPRRVVELQVTFSFRDKLLSEREKAVLEQSAKTCPVWYSLHPDIKKIVEFKW